MAHDPKETAKYIADARSRFAVLKDPVQSNYCAAIYLRAVRMHGDCQEAKDLGLVVPDIDGADKDESLADAEHYCYARYLNSVHGDPCAHALVDVYGAQTKHAHWSVPQANKKYDVLPWAEESEIWGHKGMDDGLRDYQAAHDGKTGDRGSAVTAQKKYGAGAAGYGVNILGYFGYYQK